MFEFYFIQSVRIIIPIIILWTSASIFRSIYGSICSWKKEKAYTKKDPFPRGPIHIKILTDEEMEVKIIKDKKKERVINLFRNSIILKLLDRVATFALLSSKITRSISAGLGGMSSILDLFIIMFAFLVSIIVRFVFLPLAILLLIIFPLELIIKLTSLKLRQLSET